MYRPRSYTIVDHLSPDEIEEVWNNACSMNGIITNTYRYDHRKRIMYKGSYKMYSKMGWYIEHIISIQNGGKDSTCNMRAVAMIRHSRL